MAGALQSLTAEQMDSANRAFRLLQQGKAGDALRIARRVALERPNSADAHHLLALCHKALPDHGEAEKAFQRALELAADSEILGNYANFLKQLGRFDEALQNSRRAVKAAPTFVNGWITLGLVALGAGRTAEARDALERAVRLQPNSAAAWHALGNVNRADDNLENAEKAFRKAVALRPGNGAAWVNLSVVVKLLGRPAEALPLLDEARKAGLFPSYMWHGTVPFEDADPRVTIAFDMRPADQGSSAGASRRC